MSWAFLCLAILFEVAGTVSMKISKGLTQWLPSLLIFFFYGLSFGAFALALKEINLSIAYTLWAGIGTVLICIVGVFWFTETLGPLKIISIALILIGVIGINLSDGNFQLSK